MKNISTNEDFRWPIYHAALEFGINRSTLRTRLARAGINAGPDRKFSTKDILAAIYSPNHLAKLRQARALADLAEMERDAMLREMVSLSAAERAWAGVISNATAKLAALPAKLAPLLVSEPLSGVQGVLEAEVHKLCEEFSQDPAK